MPKVIIGGFDTSQSPGHSLSTLTTNSSLGEHIYLELVTTRSFGEFRVEFQYESAGSLERSSSKENSALYRHHVHHFNVPRLQGMAPMNHLRRKI